jgi:hypothetical protein
MPPLAVCAKSASRSSGMHTMGWSAARTRMRLLSWTTRVRRMSSADCLETGLPCDAARSGNEKALGAVASSIGNPVPTSMATRLSSLAAPAAPSASSAPSSVSNAVRALVARHSHRLTEVEAEVAVEHRGHRGLACGNHCAPRGKDQVRSAPSQKRKSAGAARPASFERSWWLHTHRRP